MSVLPLGPYLGQNILWEFILEKFANTWGRESTVYPNGDQVQYFTVEFYCREWPGVLAIFFAEAKENFWDAADNIFQMLLNDQSAFRSLAYFRKTGKSTLRSYLKMSAEGIEIVIQLLRIKSNAYQ